MVQCGSWLRSWMFGISFLLLLSHRLVGGFVAADATWKKYNLWNVWRTPALPYLSINTVTFQFSSPLSVCFPITQDLVPFRPYGISTCVAIFKTYSLGIEYRVTTKLVPLLTAYSGRWSWLPCTTATFFLRTNKFIPWYWRFKNLIHLANVSR